MSVKDVDDNTLTDPHARTHVQPARRPLMVDVVTDKDSSFVGSQSNQIVSRRLFPHPVSHNPASASPHNTVQRYHPTPITSCTPPASPATPMTDNERERDVPTDFSDSQIMLWPHEDAKKYN